MNFAEVFKNKMDSWGISGKELAAASGRSTTGISQIRKGVVSPSIADFQQLIQICDGLRPGFAADYYAALSPDTFSPEQLVKRLDSSQLASLMHALGERIRDFRHDSRFLKAS